LEATIYFKKVELFFIKISAQRFQFDFAGSTYLDRIFHLRNFGSKRFIPSRRTRKYYFQVIRKDSLT